MEEVFDLALCAELKGGWQEYDVETVVRAINLLLARSDRGLDWMSRVRGLVAVVQWVFQWVLSQHISEALRVSLSKDLQLLGEFLEV